jgi:hypothetical protein
MMRSTLTVSLIVAVMLLGEAVVARADSCFFDVTNNVTLVGQGFLLPPPNACRPFSGFFLNEQVPINGTACGTSDRSTVRFTLQYSSAPGGFVAFATMALPRSSGEGSIQYCFLADGSCTGIATVVKDVCPSSRPFR